MNATLVVRKYGRSLIDYIYSGVKIHYTSLSVINFIATNTATKYEQKLLHVSMVLVIAGMCIVYYKITQVIRQIYVKVNGCLS